MPTLEVFKAEIIKTIGSTEAVLKSEVISALKDVVKYQNSENDLEYIKQESLEYCRQQEFKLAIADCAPLIFDRDFDRILTRINDAYKKGTDFSVGHRYLDSVEDRYQDENLMHITTGWDVIDEITGGGLPKKKLGTISAALGAGKTFMAVHLGAAALEAGYTVLHITLELNEYEVGQRYDARLSGYGIDNLNLHLPELKKKLNTFQQRGQLIIKEFLGGITLFGIENYIDQCILLGIIPDLIIIDYDELIDIPKSWESHRPDQQLQLLHRELRRKIAIGKNVALWVPIQASKEGADEDVVRMSHAANAYGKGREADLSLTLSRKEQDKTRNTARISVGKNRIGPDGMVFPAHFDTSKSIIKIYRESSKEGKNVQDKMISNGEFQRQYALNRYEQIMNSGRNELDDKTDIF
jgi:hypothetical protein